MKTFYLLFIFICYSVTSFAQGNFNERFNPVETELTTWDPVRGAWLSESMDALAHNNPVPERTFPENFTPHQMMTQVPTDVRGRIESNISNARTTETEDLEAWSRVEDFMSSQSCSRTNGRSYGDPHLVTFDGARYSFQTVGEFRYAKLDNGNLEVQTRQKPQSNSFSLNTAVAMNVSGDRVCLYASDYPDQDYSSPLRVNGEVIKVGDKPYFLNNGGTVREENGNYVIDWPTGEALVTNFRQSNGMRFLDVNLVIVKCVDGNYSGLMGNANGIETDDFYFAGSNNNFVSSRNSEFEKRRQIFLSKEFADVHRITQAESLFDYAIGESTFTFTDKSFPLYYPSLDNLTADDRLDARRRCQEAGISALDMNGCIYDRAHLRIPPSLEPKPRDPTTGITLKPVRDPVPNTNPRGELDEIRSSQDNVRPDTGPQPVQILRERRAQENRDNPTSKPTVLPTEKEPTIRESRPTTTSTPETRPSTPTIRTTPSRPTTTRPTTTRPTSRPTVRPTPKPKPRITPSKPRGRRL